MRDGALFGQCPGARQIGLGQREARAFQIQDAGRVGRLGGQLCAFGGKRRQIGLRLRERQLVIGGVDPQHLGPLGDQATWF